MANFSPTQGRYLSFIQAYTNLHGYPPSESEIAAAMCVSPPSVNQMVKMLEKKGLIQRTPGQARTLRVLVSEEEVPMWNSRANAGIALPQSRNQPVTSSRKHSTRAIPPTNLYVLLVFLTGGPLSEKFHNKECSRVIEIRGDHSLDDLHQAIFDAYDREEQHLYEFQLGKRPFDPQGPNSGTVDSGETEMGDARLMTLDNLDLKLHRTFGYWFDFGADWFHQVQVERIEQAIPTVTYPRVIKRKGKSPPQFCDEE